MKILTASQIKEADKYTIENEPIASIELMERAITSFINALYLNLHVENKVFIFCGNGNNGGDGLGIGRHLTNKGFEVEIFLVKTNNIFSDDNLLNQEKLKANDFEIQLISDQTNFPTIPQDAVIIDALLGSGLNKPLKGIYAELVNYLNQQPNTKYAVDIPSGLFADKPSSEPIIKADFTFTFQCPKLSFLLPENQQYTGEWQTLDVQLHPIIIEKIESNHYITDSKLIQEKLKSRDRFSHKGTYGHTLIIAGSKGKMGAAILSSKAAFKAGAGLVTAYVPQCGYNIIQGSVPEVMCMADQREDFVSSFPENINSFNTIAIGPGIGTHQETSEFLEKVIKMTLLPMVIDADALNILSENKDLLNSLPKNSILTPHPKEFERLAGKWNNGFERLEKQKQFCEKYKVILVLKDAYTSICNEGRDVFFNTTGNPGMATGGSGDVLTGIIAGLLAQKYAPFDAAVIGCFLHGIAGDLALENESMESLMSGDIITNLGKAFNKVRVTKT